MYISYITFRMVLSCWQNANESVNVVLRSKGNVRCI